MACSSPPPPAPQPAPTAVPTAAPKAPPTASASAAAPAPPPEPLTTAPTIPSLEDAERAALPESLANVQKAFDDKFYSEAADLIQVEIKKRGAPIEHQVLLYGLLGHARHMTHEMPLATRAYRRVISKWGPFYKAGKKLQNGGAEEQGRYQLGLEAFGESLFFLAELKREKLADIHAPSFDKEDNPAMVKAYVDGKLAGYLARAEKVIQNANKEYDKVLALKPKPPARWAAAAHSRVGAMYGSVLEEVRGVGVKKENRGPIDEKAKRFADKARAAYESCQSAGSPETMFTKSCSNWLAANK